MKQRRHILTFLLFFLLGLPLHVWGVELVLPDLQGQQRSLEEYRGKWVLVNFWATWCSPCVKEMPELQEFHQQHKDRDAVVLGVNMEDLGPVELQAFLDRHGITYPILLAPLDEPTPLGQLPGLPTSYLINPEGELAMRQVGLITAEMIEQYMQQQADEAPAEK